MNSEQILNYRIVGNGYPVLFLHGFLACNQMWKDLLPVFSKYFKCILIELPGHGQSPDFSRCDINITALAKSVKLTIQQITSKPFDIVGHSLGGYVALDLIQQLPNFQNKLILLNSHPWADSEAKKAERDRVIKVVEKNKALFIKTAIPNLYRYPEKQIHHITAGINIALSMDTDSIANSLKAMRDRSDRTDVLKKLTRRCLVIQGEFDHLIPATKMERITKALTIQFSLIREVGHMAHHESSLRVEKEVLKFLT